MILASGGGGGGVTMIIMIVVLFAVMYFVMIRPQNKERKQREAMISQLAVGDAVLTSSGFYGVIIDITDEDVIVEFGNNRNCRIPMRKEAIAQVEKAGAAAAAEKPEKISKKEKTDKTDSSSTTEKTETKEGKK